MIHFNRSTPLLSLLAGIAMISAVEAGSESFIFPASPFVKNVKTVFGARGDGKTDDTEALRKAFKDCDGIVYLPNGAYRVTGSIICKGLGIGPWICGQSRDSVIIRLDDRAPGFGDTANPQPVIAATSHQPGHGISADQFFRQWRHFTVDAGKNAGAIGVRYYSNNSGTLDDVTIKGSGRYGLDLGWVDQNGPCLIRDVAVDGFEIGIFADRQINSQTMTGVTVRNCRRIGLYCKGQNLSIEDIAVENVPLAMDLDGIVCIVNARFTGTDPAQPAIRNRGTLFCRSIVTHGFSRALDSGDSTATGDSIAEFASNGVARAFGDSRFVSLGLPIRKAPTLPWEADTAKWVNVADFGAIPGDTLDDSKSLQAAIDSSAAQGKTTIYLHPGVGRGPNHYILAGDVHVHGSVRHIIGLGFGRVISATGTMHGFVLDSNAAPIVKFENIYSFAPGVLHTYMTNDPSTLIVENCEGFMAQASGKGDLFINNSAGHLAITNPSAHVWARQWNTEGRVLDTDNNGGTLWILGLKTERGGTKIRTANHGRTELLGAHIYNICDGELKTTPLFEIADASATFASVRESCFCGPKVYYGVHVKETRNGTSRDWHAATQPGSWSLYSGIISSPGPRKPPPASSSKM